MGIIWAGQQENSLGALTKECLTVKSLSDLGNNPNYGGKWFRRN